MHSVAERAYVAGFLDGEGHIGLHRRNKADSVHCVHVSLANTNIAVLLEIQALWGGYLQTKSKLPLQKIGYDLRWNGGRSTTNLLKELLPYLRVKREQAKIALAYNETLSSHYSGRAGVPPEVQTYRKTLVGQMHKRNQRGSLQSERISEYET